MFKKRDDPDAIKVPAHNTSEERIGIHGNIDGKSWTVFYTMRGDVIRLITCRPGRNYERAWYDAAKDKTKTD